MRKWVGISCAWVIATALLCSCAASAQQPDSSASPRLKPRPEPKPTDPERRVQLDVRVEDALGRPVSGLTAADFFVFDNLAPMKTVSFAGPGAPGDSVEIIFVIDTLSSSFEDVARARQQLSGYLKREGGHLAHPVTIVWLQKSAAKGRDAAQDVIPIGQGKAFLHVLRASSDGTALAQQLDRSDLAVSGTLVSQGVSSDAVQLSLQALEVLATGSADRPSRKMLLWLSPGWPLLSQPSGKRREQLFDFIVYMYGELRRARVTLYALDPTGISTAIPAGDPLQRSANPLQQEMLDSNESSVVKIDPAMASYSAYLKSPLNAKQAQPNAMSLQVLALQTGGMVLQQGNDIGGEIARCVAEADSFYTLSYEMPASKEANEFHATQVTVNRRGVSVRTRAGYYAQPLPPH